MTLAAAVLLTGIAATLATLAAGAWIDTGEPVVLLGDPALARLICSSASAWPPASKAAATSATPPPPGWSTSSPKQPTTGSCPASWAATAASTCSCSATSSSTPESTARLVMWS